MPPPFLRHAERRWTSQLLSTFSLLTSARKETSCRSFKEERSFARYYMMLATWVSSARRSNLQITKSMMPQKQPESCSMLRICRRTEAASFWPQSLRARSKSHPRRWTSSQRSPAPRRRHCKIHARQMLGSVIQNMLESRASHGRPIRNHLWAFIWTASSMICSSSTKECCGAVCIYRSILTYPLQTMLGHKVGSHPVCYHSATTMLTETISWVALSFPCLTISSLLDFNTLLSRIFYIQLQPFHLFRFKFRNLVSAFTSASQDLKPFAPSALFCATTTDYDFSHWFPFGTQIVARTPTSRHIYCHNISTPTTLHHTHKLQQYNLFHFNSNTPLYTPALQTRTLPFTHTHTFACPCSATHTSQFASGTTLAVIPTNGAPSLFITQLPQYTATSTYTQTTIES